MIILNAFNNRLSHPALDAKNNLEQSMRDEASALKTAAVAAAIFAVAVFLAFQGPLSFIFSAVILVGCYDLFSISSIQTDLVDNKFKTFTTLLTDDLLITNPSKYLYKDTIILKHIVANKK